MTTSKITYVVVLPTAAERAETRKATIEAKKLAFDFEFADLL
jgi:hypothetical protein